MKRPLEEVLGQGEWINMDSVKLETNKTRIIWCHS